MHARRTLAGLALAFAVGASPASAANHQRFVAVAKSAGDFAALRQEALRAGATILQELPSLQMIVASAPESFRDRIGASAHAAGVAKDHVTHLVRPEMKEELLHSSLARQGPIRVDLSNPARPTFTPDPAMGLPGLMWNVDRIRAPQAWPITSGSPSVKVAVADTGLDYTHPELAKGKVAHVEDLTVTEDPPLCKTFFGTSDQDLAATFGGPVHGDWNGHGTWIGGNIAANLDGVGINGIAPKIELVALKISQWCGSAYDSTILAAFLWAADHGIDVVSISFGGYLDLRDPDQHLLYAQYVQAVSYAYKKGTVIVASAGNEHLQIGLGGLVTSHGPLTTPGTAPGDFQDFFGLVQNPGGVPLVVDVASTGNVVASPSSACTGVELTSGTCKPAGDAHQSFGVGRKNQLAYYSNYGPRIDVAAPGGARKFNLPAADRGGTPGFPWTDADGTIAFETFSITSNWAVEIPCFVFAGDPFYPNACYSTIQGTSMATPHVSAALALIASRFPIFRHNPALLLMLMKTNAQRVAGNATPPLSATDHGAGDLTGVPCPTGFCHLGGRPIPDSQAYGAGLVDASGAL